MNNAVSQIGDKKWYCWQCQLDMLDDIEDVEIDDSLQVCLEELELQSK